jgi:hypothetical protein
MTNRERAEKIMIDCFPAGASSRLRGIGLFQIERALEEAKKRHNDKCFSKDKNFEAGKIEGQREMRERAALESFGFCSCASVNPNACACVKQIRALPIEGE